jgi:uncharacterized protein (DUF983 family)
MHRSIAKRSQETATSTQFSLGFVAVLVVVWDSAFKIVLSMSLWFQGLVNFSFWTHLFICCIGNLGYFEGSGNISLFAMA